MPALRLLHRRWGIASDDVILAMPPLLFHLAWVVIMPVSASFGAPPYDNRINKVVNRSCMLDLKSLMLALRQQLQLCLAA